MIESDSKQPNVCKHSCLALTKTQILSATKRRNAAAATRKRGNYKNAQNIMDTLDTSRRSALMSRIRSKNTQPELKIRSLLHRMGYRFRLHRKDLPGKPDIVLPRLRKIILVHGCFWHGHDCSLGSKPKSNSEYWSNKITNNRNRDQNNTAKLKELGWSILVLWECDIRNNINIEFKLREFLEHQEQR